MIYVLDMISTNEEELISRSKQFLLEAISDAIQDPINNRMVANYETPGNLIVKLAKHVLSLLQASPQLLETKSAEVVGNVAKEICKVHFSKAKSREQMWCNILHMMQNDIVKKTWTGICDQFSNSTISSFHQYICTRIVNCIVIFENERKRDVVGIRTEDLHLTDDEQRVLYYVAGFIVFSMIKKYKKLSNGKSNAAASAALQFFLSLKVSGNSSLKGCPFLDFAKKWMEIVDRGGLIKVNDEMFIFVRRVENVVRQVLNEDLRECLQTELEKSKLVSMAWDSLSRNMSNSDLVKILKKQILAKWVDIRGRSFVSSYIQILKHKLQSKKGEKEKSLKLSKAGEPAMRKTLF